MQFYRKWMWRAMLNLVLVALAGVVMRYKIVFSLPIVHQKNLLHAHSHFAFSGWISLALCTLLIFVLEQYRELSLKKYNQLLLFSQVGSFGMLLLFPFLGYAAGSIFFSTLYIVFSYLFTYRYIRDSKQSTMPSFVRKWFVAGLLLWSISSLGAFGLGIMMAAGIQEQYLQIGSIYFFLHFQYNGWFLFALLGLTAWKMRDQSSMLNRVYLLLLWSIVPSFFLATLWMDVPQWVEMVSAGAAIAQLAAMTELWKFFPTINKIFPDSRIRLVMKVSFGCLLLKLMFQALSVVPFFSRYAFASRPIVIGFLHLVLLGCISLYILSFAFDLQLKRAGKWQFAGLLMFTALVVFNELLLFTQGACSILLIAIPWAHPILLAVAAGLFLSGLLMLKKPRNPY